MTTKTTFSSVHHTNPTLTCFISTGNNRLHCVTLTPTTPHCSLLTWQRCIFVKEFALRWIKRLVSNLTFNPNLPSLKAAFCLFKASQSRALCLLLAARGKSLSCQQRLNTRWLHRHREPLSLSNKGISLARKRLIVADVKTYFSDLRPKPEPSGGNLISLVWTYL